MANMLNRFSKPAITSGAVRTMMMVMVLTLTVSACGRKGGLEPPGTPIGPAAQEQDAKKKSEQENREKQKKADRPFFLDPLLD